MRDEVMCVKDTLTMIMSPKAEYPSTSRLCSALQAALQESMNLPGPQLIHFIKFLLDEHQSWVRVRSFQDIFSKNLGIDVLLHGSSEVQLPSHPTMPPAADGDAQEVERPPGGALQYTPIEPSSLRRWLSFI